MKIIITLLICLLPGTLFAEVEYRKACVKDTCIQAEMAVSDYEHQMGLMHREGLAEDTGMLFVFDREDTYPFWMKNMRFSLDIIWISEEKRIVDIKEDVLPCQELAETCSSLMPCCKARYVIEVKAGFVKEHKINVGDKVWLDPAPSLY